MAYRSDLSQTMMARVQALRDAAGVPPVLDSTTLLRKTYLDGTIVGDATLRHQDVNTDVMEREN